MNWQDIEIVVNGEKCAVEPKANIACWQRSANELNAVRAKLAAADARIAELTAAKPENPVAMKLLPCPFCGKQADGEIQTHEHGCFFIGSHPVAFGTIDRWNRRAARPVAANAIRLGTLQEFSSYSTGCAIKTEGDKAGHGMVLGVEYVAYRADEVPVIRKPTLGETEIGRKVLAHYVRLVRNQGIRADDGICWSSTAGSSLSHSDICALARAAAEIERGEP